MRLIDADNILNDFCCYCNQEACEGGMHGTKQECETIRMLRDVIEDTPTVSLLISNPNNLKNTIC